MPSADRAILWGVKDLSSVLKTCVLVALLFLAACVSKSDPAVSDYRRGLAAYSAGLNDRAIAFFTSAIDRQTLPNADQANAYERRCAANIAKGFFAVAISDCSDAIALNNQLAPAYNGRCWARARTNQAAAAVSDCEKAVDLDRDEKSYVHNLGFVYETLGDPAKAKTAYGRALTIDSTYVEARDGLARVIEQINANDG